MTHKLSILLVEDEKNICDFISTSLSAQDYRISTAHTGKEALPIITSQCPDLILLDLGLPDMDGMEIIRQVRTWSSVPIIVLNTDSPLYKRPFHAKGLTIDFEKHLVSVDGKDVHLTQIEFKIISLLAQNSGRVMTYDTIISNIWGPYADDDNSILRVNMAHIRRKLEQNPAEPQYVFTEIGIGYRMIEDEMQ